MFTETLPNIQPPAKGPLMARRTCPAVLLATRLSQEFVLEVKKKTNKSKRKMPPTRERPSPKSGDGHTKSTSRRLMNAN